MYEGLHDAAGMVTAGGPRFRRDPDEIAAIMDLRAKRAIDHVTGLAWGKTPRICPVCGYEGPFSPVRHKPEIWCPCCDSRPGVFRLHDVDEEKERTKCQAAGPGRQPIC